MIYIMNKHTDHFHNACMVENTFVNPTKDKLSQAKVHKMQENKLHNLTGLRVSEIMPLQTQKDDVQTDLSSEIWFEKVYDAPPHEYAINYCGAYHDCPPNPVMNYPKDNWNTNNWYNKPLSHCPRLN